VSGEYRNKRNFIIHVYSFLVWYLFIIFVWQLKQMLLDSLLILFMIASIGLLVVGATRLSVYLYYKK
jgi:hypothetical protein